MGVGESEICRAGQQTGASTGFLCYRLQAECLLFFNIYLFLINFFLAALGLCCCAWAFSSCGKRGLLFIAMRGLLIVVASLVAEHGLQVCGLQQLQHACSLVAARGLSSCGMQALEFAGLSSCGMWAQQLWCAGSRACGLQQLWHTGSVVVAHGLSCSVACGIFPDQGQNPCPLHWQADS